MAAEKQEGNQGVERQGKSQGIGTRELAALEPGLTEHTSGPHGSAGPLPNVATQGSLCPKVGEGSPLGTSPPYSSSKWKGPHSGRKLLKQPSKTTMQKEGETRQHFTRFVWLPCADSMLQVELCPQTCRSPNPQDLRMQLHLEIGPLRM